MEKSSVIWKTINVEHILVYILLDKLDNFGENCTCLWKICISSEFLVKIDVHFVMILYREKFSKKLASGEETTNMRYGHNKHFQILPFCLQIAPGTTRMTFNHKCQSLTFPIRAVKRFDSLMRLQQK